MKYLSNIILLFFISLFVILVNYQIISFNMMYPEQPEMYLANQTIHSWHDLLNVYLHPMMMNLFYMPFFRPSGHFLVYQLLSPLLGWHHTQYWLIVNLLFLALTGFMIIKTYNLLFTSQLGFHLRHEQLGSVHPCTSSRWRNILTTRSKHAIPGVSAASMPPVAHLSIDSSSVGRNQWLFGGYIAFAIYLMHPAMILPRLTVLHFEFASVFFILVSLYCFILFLRKNNDIEDPTFGLLAISLLCYVIAVTFKESAIMLGPMLVLWGLISTRYYKREFPAKQLNFFNHWWKPDTVMLLITLLTITLAIYLTLPWPNMHNPVMPKKSAAMVFSAIHEGIKIMLSSPYDLVSRKYLLLPNSTWRVFITPWVCHVVLWIGILFALTGTFLMRRRGSYALLFLWLSAGLFFVVPVAWGMASPWHFNLSILCLSLIIGFSIEYLLTPTMVLSLALLIGLTPILVNKQNIDYIVKQDGFSLLLSRNAVLHPPDIKKQLTPDSLIVIENSTQDSGYTLGSRYPLLYLLNIGTYDFNYINRLQQFSFFKFDSVESGTFFKLAYLMPTLREQVYPFQVANMQTVPNIVLHHWLKNYNTIFCVGYDSHADWRDLTAQFKKNLLLEKDRRHLIVRHYHSVAMKNVHQQPLYTFNLPFPEVEICELACDLNKRCNGFVYLNANRPDRKCLFYQG